MDEQEELLEGVMIPDDIPEEQIEEYDPNDELPAVVDRKRKAKPAPFVPTSTEALIRMGVIHPDTGPIYEDSVKALSPDLMRSGATGKANRQGLLSVIFHANYEVTKRGNDEFFCRKRGRQVDPGNSMRTYYELYMQSYTADELDDLAKQMFFAIFTNPAIAGEVGKACAVLRDTIVDRITDIDMGLIILNNHTLFDTRETTFIDMDQWITKNEKLENPEPLPRAYIKLGKSSGDLSGDRVRMPEITDDNLRILKDEYYLTLNVLSGQDEYRPDDEAGLHYKKIIMEWADGEEEVYRDIIHMFSTVFTYRKPLGAYFLTGKGRNGKSSCLHLISSIVGTDNTSQVSLDELVDPHQLDSLRLSLLNAPDESGQAKDDKGEKQFKIAAAHEGKNAVKFFSQKKTTLTFHCASLFPVNELPKWSGSSASTCLKRTLPIPFFHLFEDSDLQAGKSWGELNFTDEFLLKLTGEILAYAHYYARNAWKLTTTMLRLRGSIEAINSSDVSYINLWETYCRGFQKFKLVKQDYRNYCIQMDVQEKTFTRGSVVNWASYSHSSFRPKNARNHISCEICPKRTLGDTPQADKLIMYDDFRDAELTQGKTLKEFHEFGGSLIYEIEERKRQFEQERDETRGYTDAQRELFEQQGKLYGQSSGTNN